MFGLNHMFRLQPHGARRDSRRRQNWKSSTEILEERRLLSADVVLDWHSIALEAVKNDYDVGQPHDQPGPTEASRALAIVQLAVYDTLNCFEHGYESYLVDKDPKKKASSNAAVAQAAHDTLAALFPHQTALFDAALTDSLQGVDSKALKQGTKLGQNVAKKILKDRQHDGSDHMMNYSPGDQPGEYRQDPLHPDQSIVTPKWGKVAPFVVKSSKQFVSEPPPDMNSQEYIDAYNEVKALGGDGINTPTTRSAEQTEIGIFWGYDGSPGVGVPPRIYNQIARVIAIQQNNTEMENARMFAMVNLAMADAGITAWQTKFDYEFWRPVTAIRESDPGTGPTGLGDGNPNTIGDPTWTPLGAPADNNGGTNFTPAFPAYVSGHASFGAAAFRTMANFYGTDDISFSFMSDEFNGITKDQDGNVRPVVTRSYTSFSQAAEENGQSRIYLGIHWSFDKTAGIEQGNQIADYVASKFAQPV